MKRFLSKALSAVLLCSAVTVQAASCDTSCPTLKCYKRRSDSRHKYIQMVGSVDKAHVGDAESMYGVFTITPGYRGSFKHKDIAKCLFGDHLGTNDGCCDPTIKVEGSAVTSRDPNAWLADYFYLPRNYKGSFKVEPRIKTLFVDLDLFVGLDDWLCGLYFRLWGDIVHTSWNLGLCCKDGLDGSTAVDHQHGYFSPAPYEATNLLSSFCDYSKGNTPKKSTNVGTGDGLITDIGATEGITNATLKFQGLQYARMLKCSKSETGFADLRAELGWDFWQSECYHLGLNIQFAAPTGQKKEPCVLFDAMVGNGNHWEVGGGITGHYVFWRSEDTERAFSFHLDANFTHLFKERIQRTFDLKGKPNSAYMLAAKFGPNTATNPADQVKHTNGANTDENAIIKQFAGEYAPVANLSTTSVDVSVGVQSDIVAMFNYTCGAMSWDLGYNFWGHGCEKIECPEACKNTQSLCQASQQSTWALKGDARMFGYNQTTQPGTATPGVYAAIPLSSSQKDATLLNGLNKVTPPVAEVVAGTAVANVNDRNLKVDNATGAYLRAGEANGLTNIPGITGAANQVNTSNPPVFLSCDSLEFTRIKGISHTIFTNLSYSWERECWSPFMGLGLAAEFASNDSCCSEDRSSTDSSFSCGPCVTCNVSQWSVWLMGGMSFN